MTKSFRDEIALAVAIADEAHEVQQPHPRAPFFIAKRAYEVADALLAARGDAPPEEIAKQRDDLKHSFDTAIEANQRLRAEFQQTCSDLNLAVHRLENLMVRQRELEQENAKLRAQVSKADAVYELTATTINATEAIAYCKLSDRPEYANRHIVRALAAKLLKPLRLRARECGYALGLHGSVSRDLDLIAVPWREENVMAPIEMVHALRDVVREVLDFGPHDPAVGYQMESAKKPHGREGFSIHLVPSKQIVGSGHGDESTPYIDISVIHPREQP